MKRVRLQELNSRVFPGGGKWFIEKLVLYIETREVSTSRLFNMGSVFEGGK